MVDKYFQCFTDYNLFRENISKKINFEYDNISNNYIQNLAFDQLIKNNSNE